MFLKRILILVVLFLNVVCTLFSAVLVVLYAKASLNMSDWQNDRSRPILGRLGRMDGKSSSRSSKRAFYTQGTKKSYRTGGFQSKSFRKRRIWLTKKTIGEIDDVLLLFAINYRITAGNKVDLLDEGEASYHSFVYLTWRGLYYVRPKRKRRIIPYRLVCILVVVDLATSDIHAGEIQ